MSGWLENLLTALFGRRLARTVVNPQVQETSSQEPGAAKNVEESTGPSSGLAFAFRFLIKDKASLAGMVIVGLFLTYALIEGLMQEYALLVHHPAYGWLLMPSSPFPNLDPKYSMITPTFSNLAYLFGTTNEGQSVISMIMYAAPHDAIASVLVVLSGVFFGMVIGIPAGYFGSWADEALMRVTDAFLSFPALVLAIAFTVILGNGFTVVLVVLVLIWWPTYARYFRGQTIAIKSRGFVEASKLSGLGSFRIMIRHIFPNSIDPIIAQATLDFGTVLVVYSTLAFLGLGLELNYPEWGAMTAQGLPFFPSGWWFSITPGVVIIVIVVAFTLIGDRLQDLIGGRVTY